MGAASRLLVKVCTILRGENALPPSSVRSSRRPGARYATLQAENTHLICPDWLLRLPLICAADTPAAEC